MELPIRGALRFARCHWPHMGAAARSSFPVRYAAGLEELMTHNRIPGFLGLTAHSFLACSLLAGCRPADRDLPAMPVSEPADPDIQTLIHLQTKLAASLAPLDSIALDTLLAPDMRAINAGDQVLDKFAAIGVLQSAQSVLLQVQDDSIQVRRYGPVAIMTLRETVTIRTDSAKSTGRLRMTEIWLKRDGRWQAVASQASALP